MFLCNIILPKTLYQLDVSDSAFLTTYHSLHTQYLQRSSWGWTVTIRNMYSWHLSTNKHLISATTLCISLDCIHIAKNDTRTFQCQVQCPVSVSYHTLCISSDLRAILPNSLLPSTQASHKDVIGLTFGRSGDSNPGTRKRLISSTIRPDRLRRPTQSPLKGLPVSFPGDKTVGAWCWPLT